MRTLVAAATSLVAISAAHAETVTTYSAAPGQEVLALQQYKPTFPGATILNLDVGIGSAGSATRQVRRTRSTRCPIAAQTSPAAIWKT